MPDLSDLRKARECTTSVELVPGFSVALTYQPDAYTADVAEAFRRDIRTLPGPANTALLGAILVGWDLTDGGEPIACTPENIAGISPYIQATMAAALTRDLFINVRKRLAEAQTQGLRHRAKEAVALDATSAVPAKRQGKAPRPIHLRPMPPVA